MIFLTLLLVILTFLGYLFYQQITYFQRHGMVSNSWKFPLGDMYGVAWKYHVSEIIFDLYEKFKDKDKFFGIYCFIRPTIILTDLDLIEDVLTRDFGSFCDRGVFTNPKDDPLSSHLANLTGDKWRFVRNKLSPTFTPGKLKMMFHTISDRGEDLIDAIKRYSKDGPVEVKNLYSRFVADIIGACSFGVEMGALKNEDADIVNVADNVFSMGDFRMFKLMLCEAFPNLATKLKMRQFDKETETFIFDILRDAIKYRDESNVQRNDFLNMLLDVWRSTGDNDDKKFTFAEMASQAFIFFFGSYETISTMLTFAFYEICVNPDIQERLRNEIENVCMSHEGKLTYDALQEMTYLNQVLQETLRKYSAISLLFRLATKNYHVKGTKHIIEKGTHLLIPAHAIHHDTNYYKDPDTFDPDRFSPEEVKKRHQFTYMPFGEGKRICIGMRFGMLEGKFGLAQVLLKYKVTLDKRTNQPLKINPKTIMVEDLNGVWLNFEEIV